MDVCSAPDGTAPVPTVGLRARDTRLNYTYLPMSSYDLSLDASIRLNKLIVCIVLIGFDFNFK